MSSQINRLARGLIDMLGSTSQGDNPSFLAGEVRPTIELSPLYLAERVVNNSVEVPLTAGVTVGLVGQLVVPSGEVWIPINLSYQFQPTTGSDFLLPQLQVNNVSEIAETAVQNSHVLASGILGVSGGVANDRYILNYQWSRPVAYMSGTQFAVNIQTNTLTTNVTDVLFLQYQRLAA